MRIDKPLVDVFETIPLNNKSMGMFNDKNSNC